MSAFNCNEDRAENRVDAVEIGLAVPLDFSQQLWVQLLLAFVRSVLHDILHPLLLSVCVHVRRKHYPLNAAAARQFSNQRRNYGQRLCLHETIQTESFSGRPVGLNTVRDTVIAVISHSPLSRALFTLQ